MTLIPNETATTVVGGNAWPATLCLILWLEVVDGFDCTGIR